MTALLALTLVAGCGSVAPPTPEAVLAKALAAVSDDKSYGLDWTLGRGKGSLDARPGEIYWTFRESGDEYRFRRDAKQALALRPAERRYDLGPPRPFEEPRLGEGLSEALPPFITGGLRAEKGWKMTEGKDRVKALSKKFATPEGEFLLETFVGPSGRIDAMRLSGADKRVIREWRIAYRPVRPMPSFEIPSGYVPDALPGESPLPEVGSPFPGLGAGGRRLVLVTGDDEPSRRAAGRTWDVPVVRRTAGEGGTPLTATPAWYLVDDAGKIVRRWVGDDDTIVEDVRKAILKG